jgi:FKBP-type peptidyl-prolyl cis-trans isomerase SlyD
MQPLTIGPGSAVAVRYRLSLEGGVTLEAPAQARWYVQGSDGFPAVLQRALVGKKKGEVVTLTLPPAEAFGLRDPALVVKLPRERFGAIEPGERVAPDANPEAEGLVRAVDASGVTVDFNPEFADAPILMRLEVTEVAAVMPPGTP